MYNWITFVGKDAKTGVRNAFIIDAGEEYVDDVLMTIGQAFNLAVQKRRKPKSAKAPSMPPVPQASDEEEEPETRASAKPELEALVEEEEEEVAIPEEVRDMLYDIGSAPAPAEAVYDVGSAPELPPAAKAMTLNKKGEEDDVSAELLKLMQSEATAVYMKSDEIRKPDLTKLVGVSESSRLLSFFPYFPHTRIGTRCRYSIRSRRRPNGSRNRWP